MKLNLDCLVDDIYKHIIETDEPHEKWEDYEFEYDTGETFLVDFSFTLESIGEWDGDGWITPMTWSHSKWEFSISIDKVKYFIDTDDEYIEDSLSAEQIRYIETKLIEMFR